MSSFSSTARSMAARRIQKIARGRSARRTAVSLRRSRTRSAGFSIVRSLYRNREHKMVMMTTPFNMVLFQGNGVNNGVQFQGDGTIAPVPVAAAANNLFALTFSIAQVNAYLNGAVFGTFPMGNMAEYQALFDEYRLDEVSLKFVYSANSTSPTTSGVMPNILFARDYTDAGGTSLAQIQQYPDCQSLQFVAGKPHTISLKPRVRLSVLAAGGATTVSLDAGKKFMSFTDGTAPTTVEHFGLKGVFDNQLTGPALYNGYITVYPTYYVTFRSTR